MVDNDSIIPTCFGDDHQKRLLLIQEQCNSRRVARNKYSHQDG